MSQKTDNQQVYTGSSSMTPRSSPIRIPSSLNVSWAKKVLDRREILGMAWGFGRRYVVRKQLSNFWLMVIACP